MKLTDDVAVPCPVANLTSADINLDIHRSDLCFKPIFNQNTQYILGLNHFRSFFMNDETVFCIKHL